MSKIKCPICNREYEDLGKLAACITAHDKDMKCKEQEEKQKKIEALRKQNDSLYGQLKKNCEALRKLGCDARTTYSVGNLIRTPFVSEPTIDSKSLEDEINKVLQNPKQNPLNRGILSAWDDILGIERNDKEAEKLEKEIDDFVNLLKAIAGGKE